MCSSCVYIVYNGCLHSTATTIIQFISVLPPSKLFEYSFVFVSKYSNSDSLICFSPIRIAARAFFDLLHPVVQLHRLLQRHLEQTVRGRWWDDAAASHGTRAANTVRSPGRGGATKWEEPQTDSPSGTGVP